jgi:hypothetical protein
MYVGIRRRERIYIAHIVAEMKLVVGVAGLPGGLLAWVGFEEQATNNVLHYEAQQMGSIPTARLKYNRSLDN